MIPSRITYQIDDFLLLIAMNMLQASVEQLKGLPPALVVNGENDVLCDEGEAYARKLLEADVRVTAVRYHGTIHDFVMLNAITTIRHE